MNILYGSFLNIEHSEDKLIIKIVKLEIVSSSWIVSFFSKEYVGIR